MNGRLLLAGAGFLVAAAVWHVAARESVAYRIGKHWTYEMRYVGAQTNADPVSGALPEQDVLGFYQRRMRVLSDRDWPRSVVLEDGYRVIEEGTGNVLFEYVTRDTVDPKTGTRIGAAGGDAAVFPRDVQKKTYFLSTNYLEHVPVSFEGTEKIDGIDTYVFGYRGAAQYTNAYRGSAEYPGIHVADGQEIRCVDDQFYFRAWVEPATGEIAQLEEGCASADYIVAAATGRRLAAVDRWNGRSEGSVATTDAVREARMRYLVATRYMPALLLTAAFIAIAASFVRRPTPRTA